MGILRPRQSSDRAPHSIWEGSVHTNDTVGLMDFLIWRPIFSLNFRSLIPSKFTVKSPIDIYDKISGEILRIISLV